MTGPPPPAPKVRTSRHALSLHAGQAEVFRDRHRFKVVVAGRRWGKTVTSKAALIKEARRPRKLIWYVAPTYRMARQIMWHEMIAALPSEWIARAHETRMEIVLINGTRIELKGADKPDTLRGVGIDVLVIDEAQDIRPDTWFKVLRPTLASTRGTALIIGTPKSFNWFYDLYMLGQRGETYLTKDGQRRRNQWRSWQFPTMMSPFIPASEIEAAKSDMDEKSFNQEFNARFETMSGRVYYAFDRRKHLGDFAFNPKLPIWVGQDFNIDPMSSVILQPQPNGELWAVDELVLFGSNTEETGQELARRYWRHLKQVIFYPDSAGANRAHTRGETDLQILREIGFRIMKYKRKHPPVADRVNAVNRILCAADGTVILRIDRRCRHLINSLEQTIYKPGTREVDKSLGVEHSADGLGYCADIEYPACRVKVGGLSI
ncbi:terminase [Roseospira marina]|uniref:Terminase n=1 Tax=Roseospira marina TaxID=140057 RepID=A0A5M6I8B1_9PROT|nr:phage terminase large subunit [Roseospira marina]KAA5604423.1 terminase [Roseospira marina]MBB4315380.1 hypothetical protein [Roseospira marina]MBB5088475.1 hypothetical protein [Roseospira marina]